MKLTEDEKNAGTCILILIVCAALIFCSAIVSGCSSQSARANIPENELLKLKQQVNEQDELLRAYNHLLHRVWIDKPVYVEECLNETDEFIELYNLLDGNWQDTFSFYNDEDSISYQLNWEKAGQEGCVTRVVRHIVIPEPTKTRLRGIFGNTSSLDP